MKKKNLIFILSFLLIFMFTACGGSDASDGQQDSEPHAGNSKSILVEFDQGTIEITGARMVESGDSLDAGHIEFDYIFTNKANEPQSAAIVWEMNIEAVQGADPNYINTLEGGMPIKSFNDLINKINPGDSVSGSESFALIDATSPVTLIVRESGEEIVRMTIPIEAE